MRFISLCSLLIFLTFSHVALADAQNDFSHTTKAKTEFLADGGVKSELEKLKAQGWEVREVFAAPTHIAWNDEGSDGTFLVSVFLTKGTPPMDFNVKTLVGRVEINADRLHSLKILDARKVSGSLLNL